MNLIYLVPRATGGTETYARELVGAILAHSPEIRVTAFVNRETAASADDAWTELTARVTVPVNASNRFDWVRGEQFYLPRLAARSRVDVVHSLANTAPLWGPFRRVVTIHDLHHRLVPEAHLGVLASGMRMLVSGAAHRSDRIITPSASTADDVQRLLDVDRAKIDIIPEGIGTEPRVAPTPDADVRAWLQAGDRPIVLSVSAKRPHKNLERLISAVAEIPRERRPLLAIPGYSTPYERELQSHVVALGVEEDVRLIGWIEPQMLEGLYTSAACLVCASLHEGFGLPVLEAMARGLPVACSMRGALAEVAGEAAVPFDPESVSQIAAAIERLLSDPATANRLRDAGRARAARFTWKATAELTLASYEATMRGAP